MKIVVLNSEAHQLALSKDKKVVKIIIDYKRKTTRS